MTSRERMLAALEAREVDYIPCSFMIFSNLYQKCASDSEFVEKQVELGLDACAHAGYLRYSLHPEAEYKQWVRQEGADTRFYRRIDTPAGPLTTRVLQKDGWPTEDDFPLFHDWIVPRTEELLVKPERDLEKLRYIFGPFRDEDIGELRESARQARRVAAKHNVLTAGGWQPGGRGDDGVMGADAMAWLSGFQDVMMLSELEPELIKEYAGIIHEWNRRQIEIYLDVADPDLVLRRGWYETTEFWTPKAFKNIIAPVLEAEVDLVHQAGKKFGYIITSAFTPILDDILDTGIDVLVGLDPEEGKGTDLKAVKEKFRERKRALWGGVSGAVTVERGTKEETDQAVIRALTILGKGNGFILSPVDNVREDTPTAWENTYAFIEAWKRNRQRLV